MSYLIKDLSGNPVENNGKKVFGLDYFNVVKSTNPESRTLTMIGTDETRDRHGDIVMVNGWVLENYLKNPVFLWAHDYTSVPIGATTQLIRRKKPNPRMEFVIKFPTEGLFPFADLIFNLYNEKIINASSVGFIPYKWENIVDEDEETREMYWNPKRFLKQELLELSGCAVPANPSAVQDIIPEDILQQIKSGPVIPEKNKDDIMEEIKSVKLEVKEMEGRTLVPVSKDISETVEDPMNIEDLIKDKEGVEITHTTAATTKEENHVKETDDSNKSMEYLLDSINEVKADLKSLISNSEKILASLNKEVNSSDTSGQETTIDPKRESEAIDSIVKEAAKSIDELPDEHKEDTNNLLDVIKSIKGQFDKLVNIE